MAEEPDLLPTAPVIHRVTAPRGGVIRRIHAEAVGLVAMRLGAGRAKRDDVIDPAVGIVLTRKAGEPVKPGEPIAEIHAQTAAAAAAAEQELLAAVEIFDGAAFEDALILDVVKPGGQARTSMRRKLW
ncbi:hypothetical protein GCM10025857_13370 [Alicyclobacillus contaminans]|nr:hypothetical protein GCM10025857_13370 [Alicyclobacillus contaminans]